MTIRHLHKYSRGVVHHLPHRTRLRIPASHRDATTVRRVRDTIAALPNIASVEANERTGSILIHHSHDEDTLSNVGRAIEGIAIDLFEAILEVEEFESPTVSIIGHVIRSTVSRVNTGMSGYTGNSVDLKMLLPVAFFSLGLMQASRVDRWWLQTPAYVLFYWAYDSFMKFHGPQVHNITEHSGNGGSVRKYSRGSQ